MNQSSFIHIFDKKEPTSEVFDYQDFRIGYFNSKNELKDNEDTIFIVHSENEIIFGVSDGAGGHPRGKDAAYKASSGVINCFKKQKVNDTNVIKLFEKINQNILDMKSGSYATLSLGTIDNNFFRCYSIGDSEVIYWNSFGKIIYSNIPHSIIGHQIEGGILEQDESLDEPQRYIVNNMLGDESLRIEVAGKIPLKKGHTILIGSDGLFDNLSHSQLTEIVGKGSFEKSVEELKDFCIKKDKNIWKKDDDVSFVIIRKVRA